MMRTLAIMLVMMALIIIWGAPQRHALYISIYMYSKYVVYELSVLYAIIQ